MNSGEKKIKEFFMVFRGKKDQGIIQGFHFSGAKNIKGVFRGNTTDKGIIQGIRGKKKSKNYSGFSVAKRPDINQGFHFSGAKTIKELVRVFTFQGGKLSIKGVFRGNTTYKGIIQGIMGKKNQRIIHGFQGQKDQILIRVFTFQGRKRLRKYSGLK